MVRRHDASVVTGQLDGWIDDVQSSVYDNISNSIHSYSYMSYSVDLLFLIPVATIVHKILCQFKPLHMFTNNFIRIIRASAARLGST